MKKILLLVLTVVMAMAFMAGCAEAVEKDSEGSRLSHDTKDEETGGTWGKPSQEAAEALLSAVSEELAALVGEAKRAELTWQGHTMLVTQVCDDGSVTNGTTAAQGRYIQVHIECADSVLSWDEITKNYTDFALLDGSETVYTPVCTGFSTKGEVSMDIDALPEADFSEISPIFDVPKDMPLSELQLLVNSEKAGFVLSDVLPESADAAPAQSSGSNALGIEEPINFDNGTLTLVEAYENPMFSPAEMAETDRAIAVTAVIDKALADDETVTGSPTLMRSDGTVYELGASMTKPVDDKIQITYVFAIPQDCPLDNVTFWLNGEGRRLVK